MGPITWWHRAFLISSSTIADYRDDRAKNKQQRELYASLLKNLADAGFGLYRTNVGMQEHLVEQYSFGDHALRRFWEGLKDGVDPNGIVSPGRYGIWPKRLRQPGGQGPMTPGVAKKKGKVKA
jgi:4-cresol dehydrogenase (hydroxylating)